MQGLRIAIVDANVITQKGTEVLIKQSDVSVNGVHALADVESFYTLLEYTPVDVLLLNDTAVTPHQIEGLLTNLGKQHPRVKVIIVSCRLNVCHIQRVMRSGAIGYVSRDDDPEHAIITAIHTANRGLVYLSPKASECFTTSERMIATGDLTPTDLGVLQAMADGLTVQQAAQQLGISDRTVYRCRTHLRDVLAVPTNEMIIDAAREQGLLESE